MNARRAAVLCCVLGLAACGRARLAPDADVGEHPTLPAPHTELIPTVDIAPARGWPVGGAPVARPGLAVSDFAADLAHPRWLYVLPNGDVLVAETNAPSRPAETGSLKGKIMRIVQGRAGAGAPSANRITLLRDTKGTGRADQRFVFLEDLNAPFGVALVGDTLYVADTDAVLRFPYRAGETSISAAPEKVTDLPAGPRNHHWTKNIVASPDGAHLYASVGSNSNAAENGLDIEDGRAAIYEIDLATGQKRRFAQGLRNPVGMGFEPTTGQLWAAVNERDELGSDLVPDYMTQVKDGGFYGWPYSYYGQHLDPRVKPQRPDLVASAIVPDYALGNHTASLGLAFSTSGALPEQLASGVFVGQHGSWNRKPPSGYKVIFVPFQGGRPAGRPTDILTGFLDEAGHAFGRPVGVALDTKGALLVADDVGNHVWRVTAAR